MEAEAEAPEEVLAPNTNPNSPSLMDMLNSVQAGDPTAGASGAQPPTPLLPAPASSVPAPLAAAAALPADSRNVATSTGTPGGIGPHTTDTTPTPEEGSTGQPGFLDRLKHAAISPSGISGILSGIGTSLALAKGSPQQKQLAVEQEQIPLKMAQMQNEAAWRRGMLGINQQNANTKGEVAQTGAKTEQDKFAVGDAAMGVPEGTTRAMAETARQNMVSNNQLRQEHIKQLEATMNGEIAVPPGMGTAIGRPELEGKSLPALQFTQQVSTPYKLIGVKAQDLGEDGVWGTSPLTGRITRLGDSPSAMRAEGMLKRTQLPINDVQGNVTGWANPQTKTFTPIGSIPGATESIGTGTMPPKPTQTMLARGQMAGTILQQVPALQQEITALGEKVGAAGGRWNDFWVNKGGINDPDYAGANQDLQLYASAISMAHFGAGAPLDFTNALIKDFGMAQSPGDLQSRIAHADTWLAGYAAKAGHGEAPKNAPKTAAPSNKPTSFADWKASQAKTAGAQ